MFRTLYRCTYPLAALICLISPRPDPADWPRWRLPWRAAVRRRRRIFADDVPAFVPDRMLSTPEQVVRRVGGVVVIRRASGR